MDNYEELWRCDECREIHDDEDSARECCMPSVTELYGCLDCDGIHESKREAEQCCGVFEVRCTNCSRGYKSIDINAKAVQIAGHCTVCNPFFTLDHRLAIEDMHYLQTGRTGDVRLGES